MFETHPFIRPFDDSTHELRLIKDYNDTTNCDWRIMDLVNAMLEQGFRLEQMEEFHAQPGSHDLWWYKTLSDAEADCNREFDRTYNPWAALPQWIGFSIVKEGAKLCT